MNRNKQYIYDFKNQAPKPKTIDLWLKKYKAKESTWLETYKECFNVETKPIRRHRRSISVRDVGRLYGTNIDWLQSKINYPHWGFGRRVYRKSKDGTVWYGALMRIYFYEDE